MRYEPASWATHVGYCQAGTEALEEYAASIGIGTLGCFNDRAVRGASAPSLHREGRAFDPAAVEGTDAFVHALIDHADELGVQMVIWQRRYWRCDRGAGWHPYSGVDPHTGHAHVELTRTSARSLTIDAIRQILEEDDDMPTAEEIVEAFMARKIKTRYDVGTPAEREVEVPLEQLIANAYIEQQKG